MFGIQKIVGFLLAFFLLIGRWTPSRVTGNVSSGSFLSEPRFWIVVLLLTVIMLGQYGLTRSRPGPVRFGVAARWTLVFLAYMAMTALWAFDEQLAAEKAYEVLLILAAGLALYLGLRISDAGELRLAFWQLLVLLTSAMAVLALMSAIDGRVAVLGGGPNVFGRNMGLMTLGSLYLLQQYGMKWFWLWTGIAVTGFLLVVMTGSRGALAAVTIATIVYFAIGRLGLPRKIAIFGMVTGLLCFILVQTDLGGSVQRIFTHRIFHLTYEQRYVSGRDDLFLAALELGIEHPIRGAGLAAYRSLWGTYPHNIFLEVFCEGGGMGLLLFGVIFTVSACSFWKMRRQIDGATFAAFMLIFMVSQTSGNLYDGRGVFILLMLALIPEGASQRETSTSRAAADRFNHIQQKARMRVRPVANHHGAIDPADTKTAAAAGQFARQAGPRLTAWDVSTRRK